MKRTRGIDLEFQAVLIYLGHLKVLVKREKLSIRDEIFVLQSLLLLYYLSKDLFKSPIDLQKIPNPLHLDDLLRELKALDSAIKNYGVWHQCCYGCSADRQYYRSVYGEDLQTILRTSKPSAIKDAIKQSSFSSLLTPLLEVLDDYFAGTGIVQSFLTISTWLNFISRLQLQDVDYDTDLSVAYEKFEQGLQTRVTTEDQLATLRSLARFADLIIPPWNDLKTRFVPSFGPGVVQGISRDYATHLGKIETLVMTPDVEKRLVESGVDDPRSLFPYYVNKNIFGDSIETEIITVPKTALTRRVISKERNDVQYIQQGIMNIFNYIYSLPPVSRSVKLTDQSFAQRLALLGSKSGKFVTIDLSSASDSVTKTQVKVILAAHPELRQLCMNFAPEFGVLPNGKRLKLEKFAPMGSGHCFRMEVLVFLVIVLEAYRRHLGVTHHYLYEMWRQGKLTFSIYGDDIIVPEWLAAEVLAVLRQLGYLPNMTKSFFGPRVTDDSPSYRFRESCGMEALNGFDVTPFRIARGMIGLPTMKLVLPFFHSKRTEDIKRFNRSSTKWVKAEQFESYRQFANRALQFGYVNTRKVIIKLLEGCTPDWVWENIPFTSDPENGGFLVLDSSNRNSQLSLVWDLDLQRHFWLTKRPVVVSVSDGMKVPTSSEKFKILECINLDVLQNFRDRSFSDLVWVQTQDFAYFDWLLSAAKRQMLEHDPDSVDILRFEQPYRLNELKRFALTQKNLEAAESAPPYHRPLMAFPSKKSWIRISVPYGDCYTGY